MGKGSVPRPFAVTNEEYANRWDALFGRDTEKKAVEESTQETKSEEKQNEHQKMD